MANIPRYVRMRRRDWRDPFSWFNWFHTRNNPDPVFLYRPESGRVGMAGFTATRADSTSCATYRDANGIWQTVAANVLRDGHYHYDATAGQSYRTLLREGASTNSALGSCSFGDGTYWSNNTQFTLAAATSGLSGQVATKHTGDGATAAANRFQNIGAFVSGQTDCASIDIENVDAVSTALDIFDATAGAGCARVILTWADLSTSTTGTPVQYGAQNLGTGPNGGKRVRLYVSFAGVAAGTGGAGDTRRVRIFANTNGAGTTTTATIIHHAQFEANASYPSSPIVTVAGAVTRAADLISAPWTRNPEAGTFYIDAYMLGIGATQYFWTITNSTNTAPFIRQGRGTSRVTIRHNNGSTTVDETGPPSSFGSFGDREEVIALLNSDGSVQTKMSINSAAQIAGTQTAANALAAAWASPARLYIGALGDGSSPANLAIRSLCYVPGAEQTMQKLRQITRG